MRIGEKKKDNTMEKSSTVCPVCTLYLREGITLQSHLETHPKEQVIEALLKLSNGGQISSASHQAAPVSAESSYSPVQTITNSHSSFMSTPYANPQTQMTTAVTYQHFMTSNGSTIMPQYIQVPTVVNPNNNIPVISNQAMSFMPNPAVNYPQTMYNPMYNPYIPQPYPFTQPLYTSMPVSAMPSGDSSALQQNAQNEDSNATDLGNEGEAPPAQPSVLVKKCTVATSTQSEKRSSRSGSKRSVLKCPGTRRKRRIFRSKLSETSSSLSVIRSPVKNSLTNSSRVSAISKRSVIRTLRPKISLGTSNVNSNLSSIISPPPLTLITGTTNSISSSKTPPLPPLSKAPCIVSQSVSYIKSEDVPDCVRPRSTPAIIIGSACNNEFNYFEESPKLNSVIVESNALCQQSVSSQLEIDGEIVEEDQARVQRCAEGVAVGVITTKDYEGGKDLLSTDVTALVEEYVEGRVEPGEEVEEGEEEEEEEEDNLEKQEKVFQMIEVFEESKADLVEAVINQDKRNAIDVEEAQVNGNGSHLFAEQENVIYNKNSERQSETFSHSEFVVVGSIESEKAYCQRGNESQTSREYGYSDKGFSGEAAYETGRPEREDEEDLGGETLPKGAGGQSVTYANLQSARDSKVYPDLTLTPAIDLSNFMEVDGIKIFFNNHPNGVISYDPVVHVRNDRNVAGVLKTEMPSGNQTPAAAESVIQLISGNEESKREFSFCENYPPTTSQTTGTEARHLDLPDLSPLALDIQADESMPARGELSEQESLGAENSTWNLFHGDRANTAKSLEEWTNSQQVSVIGSKMGSGGKTFKCSACNEVFSCPKERRVHKNAVHLKKPMEKSTRTTARKPKTYACSSCSQVFSSLRDRKMHVLQNHFGEAKTKRSNIGQIKQENAEPGFVGADKADATIKAEGGQNVKTETSLPPPVPAATPAIAATAAAAAPVAPEPEIQRVRYCSHCSLPFAGVKKLREHLRIVHGENRFKCETCAKNFDEESEYKDHLLIHPLVCDKCGKKFHKKANLNLHAKRHMEVKPFECSLCPKSFITRQKLQEHMNGHSGKKPLKCTHCDKTFSRHSNLIQHRNLHHLNVKKKIKDFVCRCGEVFHSLRKLEWHKEVHEPKPKPCPFCAQKFIHSASVTRHIRRAHLPNYLPGDNREFDNVQCPVCEKVYLRSSLAVHMRVHNGEKPFSCKICNKRFSTKWNLELHNWTHQSRSNMPFKCQICKSAFFREPDFVAHLNSHRNYKPFTCNVCGQKFIRKYSCLRHQEEHKKSKQFVCAVSGCAKSFHRGYYLRDHMKVHTGVRPHTCHICGKTSSTKSNHNKHIRIHDTREPVNTEN